MRLLKKNKSRLQFYFYENCENCANIIFGANNNSNKEKI